MTITTIGDRTGADFTGAPDTFLREFQATTNFGSSEQINIRSHTIDMNFGVVLFSGLSNITGPVTVSAATLKLWQFGGPGATGLSLVLRRCLRNWVEAEATFNIYSTGNNWGTAGGVNNTSDRNSTSSGSVALDTGDLEYTITLTATGIADVEGWINGSFSNFGWHLGLDDESGASDNDNWTLWSSEATLGDSETKRPLLTVTYTASGDPEGGLIGGKLLGGGLLIGGVLVR